MKSEVNSLSIAAHELKAPLNLMRQLALSLDLVDDQATRSRIQSQLISTSERALRQVNDLTKISRLRDGLFDLEPVSVRGICDTVLHEITPLFHFERRELNFRYTNRARLAVANRELLHSVIYNFCNNAIRYSDAKTVSQLSVTDSRGKICIGVRDFGPALPTKIWRELQCGRLSRPVDIAMRPGSSGLGLYIASEFARHMRADFGAVRHRDGTSFYIKLPVSKQASFWG